MSISEKLGRAAAEIGSAADEAFDMAKTKYEEKVTPEKRAEYKEKFDKGMKIVDEKMTVVADKIESGIKGFVDGFNSGKSDNNDNSKG
ncbi:MAG: hypothetical protein IK093_15125 [Ruminiclostridium sp.]|nr:hypothetical protein [Ruminiclostridium sp.]